MTDERRELEPCPLTAEALADALSCFWNAAIGEAHNKQDATAFAVASVMAEGFAAIEQRLKEQAQTRTPPTGYVMVPEEVLRPFEKAADMKPIMAGRGEDTKDRHPADDEPFDWHSAITWGMLRALKAAMLAAASEKE